MDNDENNNKITGFFAKLGKKGKNGLTGIKKSAEGKLDERRRKKSYREFLKSAKQDLYLLKYKSAKENLEKGLKLLEQAPSLLKNGIEALYLLGVICGHHEKDKNALASVLEKMESNFNESEKDRYGLELQGLLFYLEEKFKAVILELSPLCAKKDPSYIAKLYLGLSLYKTNKFDESLMHLYDAVQEEPDHTDVHEILSDIYFKLDNIERSNIHSSIVYLLKG